MAKILTEDILTPLKKAASNQWDIVHLSGTGTPPLYGTVVSQRGIEYNYGIDNSSGIFLYGIDDNIKMLNVKTVVSYANGQLGEGRINGVTAPNGVISSHYLVDVFFETKNGAVQPQGRRYPQIVNNELAFFDASGLVLDLEGEYTAIRSDDSRSTAPGFDNYWYLLNIAYTAMGSNNTFKGNVRYLPMLPNGEATTPRLYMFNIGTVTNYDFTIELFSPQL